MKELLKQLLAKWSCSHKWVMETSVAVHTWDDPYREKAPLRHEFLFVCEKCGKFKRIDL